MRADARRNLDQILTAARDAFAELGADAPLEEIARRAGIGIATLYRRFPDRQALMRAVMLNVLERVAEEARAAREEEADAFRALARYMHRALDVRVAAVMPALLDQVPAVDDAIDRARDVGSAIVQAIINEARADGMLRADVTFGDIGMMIVRLSRPLPGPFSREMNERLAHRHLDLMIDGLRGPRNHVSRPIAGPALGLDDLRRLVPTSRPEAGTTGTIEPVPRSG